MNNHPSPEQLEELVTGALDDLEAEAAIAHLGECEACMREAEELWLTAGTLPDEDEIPTMSTESRANIEDLLFRRIRVAAVGSELAWLATGGFLSTMLALLGPLLVLGRVSESRRGAVE